MKQEPQTQEPRLFVDGPAPLALWPEKITQKFAAGWFDDCEDNEECPYDITPEGTAIVCVDGPLSQRGGWWWDGYESISKKVCQALADAKVQAVFLQINSPGGTVAGCFENVRAMRTAAVQAGKPVVAYVDEMAASAAYALACVADSIVMPSTGVVGSIGVVSCRWDQTKMLDDIGVRVDVVTSGARKADGNPATPVTDAELARLQETVDFLAGHFYQWVAERRGMTVAEIQGLEADVFWGAKGVGTRLADQIGTKADALALAQVRGQSARQQRMERRMFGAIKATFGLSEEADEQAVTAAAASLVKDKASLLEATGQTSADAAVGVIVAWKKDAATLAERVEADKKREQDERAAKHAALIKAGLESGKITPALKAWAEGQSVESLEGFLGAAQPLMPKQIKRETAQSGADGGATAKRWEDHKPAELVALKKNSPDEYEALRSDAVSRGKVRAR